MKHFYFAVILFFSWFESFAFFFSFVVHVYLLIIFSQSHQSWSYPSQNAFEGRGGSFVAVSILSRQPGESTRGLTREMRVDSGGAWTGFHIVTFSLFGSHVFRLSSSTCCCAGLFLFGSRLMLLDRGSLLFSIFSRPFFLRLSCSAFALIGVFDADSL